MTLTDVFKRYPSLRKGWKPHREGQTHTSLGHFELNREWKSNLVGFSEFSALGVTLDEPFKHAVRKMLSIPGPVYGLRSLMEWLKSIWCGPRGLVKWLALLLMRGLMK